MLLQFEYICFPDDLCGPAFLIDLYVDVLAKHIVKAV
jgi:hypothetical protein